MKPLLLALLALCGMLAATACRAGGGEAIPDTNSAYDTLPPDARRQFDLARADMERGRFSAARVTLVELRRELPDNVFVGAWLQEVEIELAAERGPEQAHAFQEELRQRERELAEQQPSAANLVLAARVEPDPLAARILIERAAELDPRCAWCPYVRAWLAASTSAWSEVPLWIERAKALDPGHMPTRWLESWLLARAGSVTEAIAAFEAWIEKAQGDRRLDRRLLLAAEIDLALLSVLDHQPERAVEILERLEDPAYDAGRRLSIEASAEQALGKTTQALETALRAEQVAPEEILPLVQQALLQEVWLGDAEAAEASWARVLEVSRTSSDLGALLERMRARVHLERFQAQRARQQAP